MKPTLEDLIGDAARRGRLMHLSIIGSWSKAHNGVTYRASFRGGDGVCLSEHADPVEALIAALTDPTA